MQTLWSLLEFLGKAVIVVGAFGACLALLASRAQRRREGLPAVHLVEVGAQRRRRADALRRALLPERERRAAEKAARARDKRERREGAGAGHHVFVVDFHGDVRASAVAGLREEVTAILGVAAEGDEVVVRLESGGGTVHGYGLAASQLARLRARAIPLTVCVDKVAASGGYLMACVASRIVAAPFAIIGSIGVLAAVPNANRALTRLGIDYLDVTAGQYKVNVSPFAPLREEGLAKLKSDIEDTHALFKAFVREMRPTLDVERVATGEHWHGSRALDLGLVDELGTSDDVLLAKAERARVFEVRSDAGRGVRARLAGAAASLAHQLGLA
jgi:serine protease SohB